MVTLLILIIILCLILFILSISLETMNKKNVIELHVYDGKKTIERVRFLTLQEALVEKSNLEKQGKTVILLMTKRNY